MEQTVEEFFHDFRQETLAGAEANSTYQLEAFMDALKGAGASADGRPAPPVDGHAAERN